MQISIWKKMQYTKKSTYEILYINNKEKISENNLLKGKYMN